MKYTKAIQGGIAGVTTLTLLEKALQNMDTKKPKLKLLNKPGVIKRLKKKAKKNGNNEVFVEFAKELLALGAYYGLIKLGKKKNALLRGGLLGAATGAAVAFFDMKDKKRSHDNEDAGDNTDSVEHKTDLRMVLTENREEILTLGLYIVGGILAGAAIKKVNKKNK